MSRFSSWWHRTFGGYGDIVHDISSAVINPLYTEFIAHPEWDADDRRSFAIHLIENYIEEKWPHYAWLIEVALDAILPFVEQRLKRRR